MADVPNEITLVVPVPADLAWEEGQVVVGPQTKVACNASLRIQKENPGSYIFLSATNAGPQFDRVQMWRVMHAYIRSQSVWAEWACWESKEFRTRGDVRALVEHILLIHRTGRRVVKVIFAVKDYHAPRLQYLVEKFFARYGLGDVVVEYATHPVYLAPTKREAALKHERYAMLKERLLFFFGVY